MTARPTRPIPPSTLKLSAGALSALFALGAAGCTEAESGVTVYKVTSEDQLIGGPSAILAVDDFILENDQIRVGVLGVQNQDGPLYSLGPGLYGGSLVDADLKRNEAEFTGGRGLDQFSENFPTVNLKITATNYAEIFEDGSAGRATLRVGGPSGPYFSLLELIDVLCVPASNGYFITDYILEPGKRYITMRSTIMLDKADYPLTDTDVLPEMITPWAGRMAPITEPTNVVDYYQKGGLIVGDFALLGGNVNVFAPGIGFDEDGAVAANPNTLVEPFKLQFVAATGDRVSYGYVAPKGGYGMFPLFSASMTASVTGALDEPEWASRTNYSWDRHLVIGEGDVASIVDAVIDIHELPHGRIEGHVVDGATGRAASQTSVFVFYDPRPEGSTAALSREQLTGELMYSQFLTDRGTDKVLDGDFKGNLPVGRWVLLVKDGARNASEPVAVTISEGQTEHVALTAQAQGNFAYTIRDQFGNLMPGKLTFKSADGTFKAEPMLSESFLSNQNARVVFSATGEDEIALMPGRYQVMVSRGIEYSLYDSANDPSLVGGVIDVPERGLGQNPVTLDVTLVKEVDTTGFVSADLHVHATPSHDSGVSLEDRAITMAAEGVEFFASTDHDFVTNYMPVIREAGLTPFVSSAVGLEITTVELGHVLGFPLEYDPSQRAGGALDWSFLTPSEMISGLKLMGAYGPDQTVATVAHPRDGILGYFDVYGYNPWVDVINPQADSDFAIRDLVDLNFYLELLRVNPLFEHTNFTLDFDALEILNAKRMDLIRTATYDEMTRMQQSAVFDPVSQTYHIDDTSWMYEIIERTMEEQEALTLGSEAGGYGLSTDVRRGQMEDWFNLLNYGYRISAVGNSDTHGTTSVEAGCPRTYLQSSTDEPRAVDPREMADSVLNFRAMPTYGPFIDVVANLSQGMGDTFSVAETGGTVQLDITIQAASWIRLDRVEIYENGVLIDEIAVDPESRELVRVDETLILEPKVDAWYVVVAMGNQDLSPVFSTVELPYIELDAIIEEALIALNNERCAPLFGAPAVFPNVYPVFPYGFTNPFWVDVDGDADGDGDPWEPPGHADWMRLDSRDLTPAGARAGQGARHSMGVRFH